MILLNMYDNDDDPDHNDHYHQGDDDDDHHWQDPSEQDELTGWDICHIVHWAEIRIMN